MQNSIFIILGVASSILVFGAYCVGYIQGYEAGLDHGSAALKAYNDHVRKSNRSTGSG